MSGIVGQQGCKSGRIGLFSGEWKLLHMIDMSVGTAVNNHSFYVGKGMQKGTFLRYRMDVSSPKAGADSGDQELWFRWSTVEGVTTGYAALGYYGAIYGHNHAAGTLAIHTEANNTQHRIGYLTNPNDNSNVTYCTVEMDNHGVSNHNQNGTNVTYSANCITHGQVVGTTTGRYGSTYCSAHNNNTGSTGSEGSGGEITAMTIGATDTWISGHARLYGLCK